MNEEMKKQMAIMTEAVQPHCPEEILSAMTCSHSGTMARTLISKIFFRGVGASWGTSGLPNPVFIAVGRENVYAFDYRPRGFKFKIKKEVARWPRKEMRVETNPGERMFKFTLALPAGEEYPLEIPVFMGGRELVEFFIDTLRS
jgi:hypothetical protein